MFFGVYGIFSLLKLKDATFEPAKKELGCPKLPLNRYNFWNGVSISGIKRINWIISALNNVYYNLNLNSFEGLDLKLQSVSAMHMTLLI